MSSEDADDERETPVETPVHWIDSRHQTFTIFIVLPNDEVCTLRDLPSGISAFDLKGKLELVAGLPAQIYSLMYTDGEEIQDNQCLLVHENIQNGYLLKMQLYENWESLYMSVIKNNIENIYHSGGVHMKGNIKLPPGDTGRIASVVRERGSVALFMASFLGFQRMVNMLLSVDVDLNATTPFGRTPLHAAAARDRLVVLDLLLKYGASIRRTDCYGFSAIDVAKDMSSDLTAKRLRVMLLNLRGMIGQNVSRESRARSGTPGRKTPLRIDLPEMPGRSKTVVDIRTRSTLSQTSEDTLQDRTTPTVKRHKRTIPLSTSLSLSDSSSANINKTNKTSVPTSVLKNNSDSKKFIKWKDAPTGNTYWQVIELDKNVNRNVSRAMDIKPVALIQQTKVLKFDKAQKEPVVPPGTPVSCKTEGSGNTPRETIFTKYTGGDSVTPKSVRFSRARPKYSGSPRHKINSQREIRRKIEIAAKSGRAEEQKRNSEAFEKWLAKKREEAERSEDDDENTLSDDNSDDEADRLREFNKRVRKLNKAKRKTLTPGNRPAPNIIDVGRSPLDEIVIPSPDTYITAYKEYQTKKRQVPKPDRNQAAGDFMTENRQLEERRRRLLLSAITYEEWLEHSEERKQLINRILQANLEEMKKLEEGKFKDRLKFYKYEDWKAKAEKREVEERKRKMLQKRWEDEQNANRFLVSSAASTFDEWLKNKKAEAQKENLDGSVKKPVSKPGKKQEELDSTFEQWQLRKHNHEMDKINSPIHRERIQVDSLRHRKTTSVI